MRINDARGREKSGIRNPPDPRVPIIVRHVLQQPVNGVVKIAGVVHVLLRFLVVDMRAHLVERSFRHIAAAHVLIDEDVSRLVEFGRGSESRAVQIHPIRPHAVGSPIDQEWIRTRSVLGHVDRGEEMNAVAHGDSVFILRVVFLELILRRFRLALGGKIAHPNQTKQNQADASARHHNRSLSKEGRIGNLHLALGGRQAGLGSRRVTIDVSP